MLNLVALNNRANKQKLKSVSRSLCRARGLCWVAGRGGGRVRSGSALWVVGEELPLVKGMPGVTACVAALFTCRPGAYRLRSYCVPTASYCVLSADANVFFRRNFDFFSRFVCLSVMYSCFVVFFAIPCLVFYLDVFFARYL